MPDRRGQSFGSRSQRGAPAQVCLAKGADAGGVAHYVDIGAGACAPSAAGETFNVPGQEGAGSSVAA